jgi:hypothetical protein
MAEYTIQLRTLLETDFEPAMDDYPIFDENYRSVLNQKILDHFYMYEIGLETPDLFNHQLRVKLNEIMPYYNEMYRIQTLIANPFHNFEYNETSSRNTDQDNTQSTSGENTETSSQDSETNFAKGQVRSHSAQSDTPQSNLTPYNVATGGYASLVNMSETESDTDTTDGSLTASSRLDSSTATTGKLKTLDEYVRSVTGAQGINKPETLKVYKSAYMNIDMGIINDLRELFMIVY